MFAESYATFNDLKDKIIERFSLGISRDRLELSIDENPVNELLTVAEVCAAYRYSPIVSASIRPQGK